MRLDDQRESDNVEDRRGGGLSIGRGGLGLGGMVLALVVSYFLGVDPSTVINLINQAPSVASAPPAHKPPVDDEAARFISKVLSSTEDTWREVFRKTGKSYQDPKLVLFTGSTPTACGTGQAAMGPFYCPGDQKVYIDLAFYRDLKDRFKAPGEFAQAYVVAHEVGHHVQHLLGISERVQAERRRRHRRRQAAAARARCNRSGKLHPWLVGAAGALVQAGLPERRSGAMRYLQGRPAVAGDPCTCDTAFSR